MVFGGSTQYCPCAGLMGRTQCERGGASLMLGGSAVFAGSAIGLASSLAWYWHSLASLCACMAAKPSSSSEKMSRWLMVFIIVNLQSTLIIVSVFGLTFVCYSHLTH